VPPYITIKQATEQEGVSRATLYRWIKHGYIKRYRTPGFDRRTHIDVEELRELRRNPPMEPID
jgi:excisionase family DNA binding protein